MISFSYAKAMPIRKRISRTGIKKISHIVSAITESAQSDPVRCTKSNLFRFVTVQSVSKPDGTSFASCSTAQLISNKTRHAKIRLLENWSHTYAVRRIPLFRPEFHGVGTARPAGGADIERPRPL